MYLKRLDIKNFRVFDEEGVSLIFNQGVNAIIGENNSGKSSVIDAIRIAYSTVTYKKDIFFSKSDFHVNEDGTTADYAQFDVFLEDVPKRLVEIWNPQSESGKGGDFHIKFEKYIAPSGMEKVRSVYWGFGTEGNSLTTDTFEATDVVFLGALRDSENEMKPSKNSKLAQLLRNMVPEEEIRKEPSKNSIPQFCVDAVVHVPFGAHPSQCYNYYDYDANFFKMYDTVTKTEEDFKAFLQEWVYDIKDNDEYIDKLGASRLTKLRVVPGFGYAAKLVKEAK